VGLALALGALTARADPRPGGTAGDSRRDAPAGVRVGELAPLELAGRGVEHVSGPAPVLRDRVVVLAFFATWCPGCVNELPLLVELHRNLNTRGVTVISISLDRPDARERRDALLAAAGVSHAVLWDREEHWKRTWQGSRTSLPYLALVDRTGVVRRIEEGYDPRRAASIRADVEALAAR
jgi:peroxiredoxin